MSGTHLNVFFGGIFQNTVVPLSMPHLSGQISDALKLAHVFVISEGLLKSGQDLTHKTRQSIK
jgi:small basic protein